MDINDDTVCTINSNGYKGQQGVQKVQTGTIGKDDRDNYSDDLYGCFGDLYVSVMMSQSDNNLCDQIKTPENTVCNTETCLSRCVHSGYTCTSLFCDRMVNGA